MTGPGGGSDQGARRSLPRRALIRGVVRPLASVVILVLLYYEMPLRGAKSLSTGVALGVGLVVFTVLAYVEVRAVLRSPYPVIKAIEALANLVPLFLLVFAGGYYVMAAQEPGSFSDPLTRTDALYFTVTVFATVGFGDIVARSETARAIVTVQMIADLLVIGVLLRVVVTAAQRSRQQHEHDGSADARETVPP